MRSADETALPSPTGWRDLPVLRVFGVLGRERVLRISAAIALVVGMIWVVGNAMPLSSDVTTWIHDSANYYAAGERLNVGHSLYAYGPGDRQTLELLFGLPSPYLYPPLIGVLFRPVAAFLPYAPVVIAFWLTGMVAFLAFLGWLLLRGGTTIAVGILVLLVPLVETAWSGNVSTFITIAIIGAWFAIQRGHPRLAGAVIGFTSVLKLSPVFLAWWLLVTPEVGRARGGRRRGPGQPGHRGARRRDRRPLRVPPHLGRGRPRRRHPGQPRRHPQRASARRPTSCRSSAPIVVRHRDRRDLGAARARAGRLGRRDPDRRLRLADLQPDERDAPARRVRGRSTAGSRAWIGGRGATARPRAAATA